MKLLKPFLAAACALAAASSPAHVTLDYDVALAGKPYKATFKVGHGCGASPTRQIVAHIPAGVRAAKPMPKPGWTVNVQREQDEVTRITWTARTRDDMLAAGHYDEFVLVARMPAQAGVLYWPVQQLCEEGRHDWTEVPKPGQPLKELKSPAARLEVIPSDGAAGHQH